MAHEGTATGTETSTSGTSVTSGSFSPSAGATILAFAYLRDEQSTDPTCSDSATALTWTLTEKIPDSGTGAEGHMFVFEAHAASAPGSITVTIDYSSGTNSTAAMVVSYYTDGDSGTPTDATGEARDTGNTKTISPNITTNNDGSFVVTSAGSAGDWDSGTEPTGYTWRAAADTGGLSADRSGVSVADKEVATAGAENHTWEDTNFHGDAGAISVELLQDGGGAPNTRRYSLLTVGVG